MNVKCRNDINSERIIQVPDVAGLARLHDRWAAQNQKPHLSPTNVGIEQEYWQSLSYLPSTAEAGSNKIKARI